MLETLEKTIEQHQVNLQIHPATTQMAMRRGMLAAAAKNEDETIRWYVARFMYPDCVACTTGKINQTSVEKLTLEDYLNLPDQITEAWLSAVYSVNAHWKPVLSAMSDEQEKKT